MAEKKEASHRAHKVVIQGTVEGYDVAPLEDLKNWQNGSRASEERSPP